MNLNADSQAEKIKQALAEVRANREHFSDGAFSQIVMHLLEKLRKIQTLESNSATKDDELRLVTVMFIDVKDSTEMLQHLQPEDWKGIIDNAHEQIAAIVDQWDGQIGQYLGDGVLCFFGAQRSRGDDAPHAVSCALQIQSTIERYARNLKTMHNIDFGLRIGISTGRVVVGFIGSHTIKQELLALGPATNLAARLQGIAPAGGVLVDSTTYNRIRRDFVTQAQAAVALKGFEDPIKSFLVLGRRSQPATQFTETRIAGIALPLVGRDDDLALISYLSEQALQTQECHVITVVGDVGMGKSRLLQEAVHITEAHFSHVVMSSQYEARTKSYNLLRDMLVTQCHLNDNMPLKLVRQQIEAYITDLWDHPDAPRAAQAFAYLAGYGVTKPDENPRELVLSWFEGIAAHQPIIIAVDNLQWADEHSVTLLELLANRLQQTATVIIGAGRPEYRTAYSDYMASVPNNTIIELKALPAETTLRLIESIFAKVERVPATLAQSINNRVEGNPLFVHEYLGMLFDNNVFKAKPDGGWRFNIIMLDIALKTLPNGLVGILQARLDDLPPAARNVIQAATISGQVFWDDAVSTLTEIENIRPQLQHLMMRGMIVQDEESLFEDETQYRFKHSLYRDVAYEMIPRTKREDFHKQMVLWLLQNIAGQIGHYPLLADQFAQSGEYLAALYTYLEAVEVLVEQKQDRDALALIDKGLSFANKIDRANALPVVTKLWAYRGEALIVLERYDEASAASQSALMLLNELSNDELVASRITAERILGTANLSLGRFTEAYDALTRAHNLLPESAIEQIASVLLALGRLYYYQGRLDDSYAYTKRAHDHANRSQKISIVTTSLLQLGMIATERGQIKVALSHFEHALHINRRVGSVPEQAEALFHIGIVHLLMLDYGKAYEYFTDAEHLGATSGSYKVLLQAYRAYTLIMLGRTTEGQALLLDATNNAPRDVDISQRLQLVSIASTAALEDYAQARDQALAFVQQERVNPMLEARAERLLGYASCKLGTSDALKHLMKALSLEETTGGRDSWLCHATLADCMDTELDDRRHHYNQAKAHIIRIVDELSEYPDIVQAFLTHATVIQVMQHADIAQG